MPPVDHLVLEISSMLVWHFVLAARGDDLIFDRSSVKKCFAVSPGLPCETLITGLSNPRDIVIDGGGGYVIADTGNDRILWCAGPAACKVVAEVTSSGVALTPEGDLLIAGRYSILRCSATSWDTCETVAGTGVFGSGLEDLNNAHAVAINKDGDYLVADKDNNRIQLCPAASPGSACETVAGDADGWSGRSPYRLYGPSDVDVDANGVYVIADTYNNRVQRCPAASPSAACETIMGTGEYGDGYEQLSAPQGVTIHDGDLFIVNSHNHRIMRCYMVAGQNLCVLVAGLAGGLNYHHAVAVLDAPTRKLTTTTSSRSTTTRNEPDVTEAAVAMVSQGLMDPAGLLLFVTNLRFFLPWE